MGNDLQRLIETARTAGLNNARQHTHGAAAGTIETLQARSVTQHHGRGTIANRRTHQGGQRVRDGRRRQDFFDSEGLLKLGKRVVHRMLVVLRRHRCDLPLGGAIAQHVIAANGGVDVHEDAVGTLGCGAGRWNHAVPHSQQRGFVLLHGGDVPAPVEGAKHLGLVGDIHLFRPHRQRDVTTSGTQRLSRQIEGR